MKKLNSIQKAFTMLELIFVIMVVGILVSLAMPRMDRDTKQEAANSILSDINHARHMALVDYVRTDNGHWQKAYWQVRFEKCENRDYFIVVGSDKGYNGDIGAHESAIDPANGLLLWSDWNDYSCNKMETDPALSKRIALTKNYGIKTITGSGACANPNNSVPHVGFDHLGRTFVNFGIAANSNPIFMGYQINNCVFTFTLEDDETFKIDIEPDTGYAKIVY